MLSIATSHELRAKPPRLAVLPIGSFEQHGPHLPVTTDTLIALTVSQAVCDQYDGLLLPPIGVSCSHEHASFAGTLSVSTPTLFHVLRDIKFSTDAQRIPILVLISAHGGNYVVYNFAQEANVLGPSVLIGLTSLHWEEAAKDAGIVTAVNDDMHGGEMETSILLHAYPHVVRREKITNWHAPDRRLLTLTGMRHYTPNGVIGFPSRGTAEKGRLLIEGLRNAIGKDLDPLIS